MDARQAAHNMAKRLEKAGLPMAADYTDVVKGLIRGDEFATEAASLRARVAQLEGVLGLAKRALDHSAPASCWAIGPMTGDPIEDLVVCPGCKAINAIDVALTTPAPPMWTEKELVAALGEVQHEWVAGRLISGDLHAFVFRRMHKGREELNGHE